MSELVLSTWSFGAVANAAAWPVLAAGGDALDAVVAGATAVEDDEQIDCVGVGGTPDADGQVSLDACVMTDPARCGSVAYVRRYPNPTAIARRVMEQTSHVMLVGAGAEEFAARAGFTPRTLLTEAARAKWVAWRAALTQEGRSPYDGWIPPRNVELTGAGPPSQTAQTDSLCSTDRHDTVCVLARDRLGQLAGACSTSGMAFKVPGRVGDSPIIGHGLYVDQRAGAAAATGNGELIMGVCGSFLAVELLRQGWSPRAACVEVLRRVAARFELRAEHQVALLVLGARPCDGWAGAALRPGFVQVATDREGTRVAPPHAVLNDV
jgi:L-asparaginase/N4-(beta-N-acetylglucosaminyl)-L-asparaginase